MTKSLYLNGSDVFFLGIDDEMRRDGQGGNVGQLAVELAPGADLDAVSRSAEEALAALLERVPVFCSAVRRPLPLTPPCWRRVRADDETPRVHRLEPGDGADSARAMLDAVLSKGLPRKGMRARFDLARGADGEATLALTWDHTLMDAQGAAGLLLALDALSRGDDSLLNDSLNANDARNGIFEGLSRQGALSARRYLRRMVAYSERPLLSPGTNRSAPAASTACEVVALDEDETCRATENAASVCGRLSETPFLLATAARGLDALFVGRGRRPEAYLFPIAYDARRKGVGGPLLGNHVAFFFYLLTPDAFTSRDDLAREFRRQTIDQMRIDAPADVDAALDISRWFPLWWRRRLTRRQFGGELGACFVSNTGETLGDTRELFGAPIKNVTSAPAVPRRPGLAIAFNRFSNRLNMTLAWAQGALSEEEKQGLIDHIRQDLLCPNGGS